MGERLGIRDEKQQETSEKAQEDYKNEEEEQQAAKAREGATACGPGL